MPTITTIEDAEIVLARYERPISTDAYTLETMRKLVEALGNPQNEISVIHVAGTSGKTSTAYYCASLLKEAGYKVGLSVSPHIDSITERTQINLHGLEEPAYCQYLSEFIDLVDQTGLAPSYFELLVAFSYWVFARKEKVDLAVMEVGLGGLLDATNVVSRSDKVCVITDIGYDHMNVLGNTINEIAHQKAGIIQHKNHVFMHEQPDKVVKVIQQATDNQQAVLHVVDVTTYPRLPLFQQRNFSLSLAAVEYFARQSGRKIDETAIDAAMDIIVPARMEAVTVDGKIVILDGSHNDQKITALVEALRHRYPDKTMTLVTAFGSHRRQNAVEGLRLLRSLSDDIIVTQFEGHQDSRQESLSPGELAAIARDAGFSSVTEQEDPKEALRRALERPSSMVVVTGSFYLLQYVR